MNDNVKQQLREAYNLIKAKQRQQAIEVLLPVLQDDEDNADAWWLLANCLTDPNDAREALDNVLRLQPEHEKAQKMLSAIDARYPRPEPEPEPEPDDFGFGDSASDPFEGVGVADAPVESDPFNLAEPAPADDPFAAFDDPFAVPSAGDAPGMADSTPEDDPFGASDPFAVVDNGGAAEDFGAAAVTFGGAEMASGSAGAFDEPDPFDDDPFAIGQGTDSDAFGGQVDAFGAPAETFGASNEPFGGPAETFGSFGSAPAQDDTIVGGADDPFGDPFADEPVAPKRKPGTQQKARPQSGQRRKSSTTSRKNDPFAGASVGAPASSAPRRSSSKSSGGTNPIVLLLAIIGAISVIACVGCGLVSLAAPAILSNVGNQIVGQLESEGFVATLEASGAMIESSGMSSVADAVSRGSIAYGESRRDTLGAGAQHAWTFNGSAGDPIRIEMLSTASDGLDAYISLFDQNGREIAFDDDSGADSNSSYNARLETNLPSAGTYTIVARTFGFSGGAYELRLNRR